MLDIGATAAGFIGRKAAVGGLKETADILLAGFGLGFQGLAAGLTGRPARGPVGFDIGQLALQLGFILGVEIRGRGVGRREVCLGRGFLRGVCLRRGSG